MPICPICNKEYSGHPALSRKDNKTKICPDCGVKEALSEHASMIAKMRWKKEKPDKDYFKRISKLGVQKRLSKKLPE